MERRRVPGLSTGKLACTVPHCRCKQCAVVLCLFFCHRCLQRVPHKLIHALIGAGANVDEPDNDGHTPLMIAAREGARVVRVRVIVLYPSARAGIDPAVDVLLQQHSNCNARDKARLPAGM